MKKIIKALFISLLLISLLNINVFGINKRKDQKPIILNYTEGALPGEAIGLQGAYFGQKPELWYAVVSGDEKKLSPQDTLEIINTSDEYISAILPEVKQLPIGKLVAVWAKNGTQLSDPVFINRARILTVEFEEIMPDYIFRVFGKNLFFQGQKPSLYFIDPQSKQTIAANVIKADPYYLQVEAPETVKPGTNYSLQVSNGSGGQWGQSIADEKLLCRENAPDPFCIGAPWGADFTFYENVYNVKTDKRLKNKAFGDGKANDRTAIQEAINLANADGGGVIYLPKGVYKLDFKEGCGLTMLSNVVLKGDGPEETVVEYGYGKAQDYIDPIGKSGWPDDAVNGVGLLWPQGTTLSGLYNLGIKDVNKSGIWRHGLKTMFPKEDIPGGAGSGFFAVNCRFDFAMDCGLAWGYVDRMILADCEFNSYSQNTWPWMWHCNGSTNFVVRNNRVYYSAGRFGFNNSFNGIIENNHITRLGDLQTYQGESGGFNIDYAKDVVVLDNVLDVVGEDIWVRNCGETILSQGCNPKGQTIGSVSSASSMSVVDEQKNWENYDERVLESSRVVAIVEGVGKGQWRYIKDLKGNTITIDRPWNIIPESGSTYVLNTWSAEDWLVKGNVLKDNHQGIMFYCGCNDVIIEGNELTNSSGIYVRSDVRPANGRFNLNWNTSIENNKMIRTLGKRAVSVYAIHAVSRNYENVGLGTLGLEVRRNLVQAKFPNVISSVKGEGYWSEVNSASPDKLGNITGIMGTIFDKNTAINCDIGYRMSINVDQTVIKDPINYMVKKLSNEIPSIRTTILSTKEK